MVQKTTLSEQQQSALRRMIEAHRLNPDVEQEIIDWVFEQGISPNDKNFWIVFAGLGCLHVFFRNAPEELQAVHDTAIQEIRADTAQIAKTATMIVESNRTTAEKIRQELDEIKALRQTLTEQTEAMTTFMMFMPKLFALLKKNVQENR